MSNARSLGGLPLHRLRPDADQPPVYLDAAEMRLLLRALRSSSDAASARLARATRHHLGRHPDRWSPERPADIAAALHRILTRSRFLKGSRSCFPLETAVEQITPFVEQRRPVTILVSGFPFKQHDNGLKAAGPWPDLAELGALLRLRELDRAFAELYPPGLHMVVLNDGGYARPREPAELAGYRQVLPRFAGLAGLGGTVHFHDQSEYVAGLLGDQGWADLERRRREIRRAVRLIAGPPRSLDQAAALDQRLSQAFPDLLPGVPGFRDIVSSLVYSVPVPDPAGVHRHDGDPVRWACKVLSHLDHVDGRGPLATARRAVLGTAWQDGVDQLAAALADNAAGVAQQHPPHVRLATVASRQGCAGFSYLGGSALLPWHGTGCLDGRGRLCADFLVSLRHRGFVPVRGDDLLDAGGATGQPLLMVPAPLTTVRGGRRRVAPDLLATARLRAR